MSIQYKQQKKLYFLLATFGIFSLFSYDTYSIGFDDNEIHENNISTATLDIELRSDQENFEVDANELAPGDDVSRDIYVENVGQLLTKYSQVYEFVSGDEDLCSELILLVEYYKPDNGGFESIEKYSGPLDEFEINQDGQDSDMILPYESDSEHWYHYQIELPEDVTHDVSSLTCEFDFVFVGWQEEFDDNSLGFWDEEDITSVVGAGEWDPPVSERDVVINEVMWSGSSEHELDEWIELYNTTDHDIDLEGWTLTGSGASFHTIDLTGVMESGEYFLITHYPTNHDQGDEKAAINDGISADIEDNLILLRDQGEQLSLNDSDDNLIDRTPEAGPGGNDWPAGEAGSPGANDESKWRSMQRESPYGDGEDTNSWFTCTDDECNDTTYWDLEGDDYGTPKSENL